MIMVILVIRGLSLIILKIMMVLDLKDLLWIKPNQVRIGVKPAEIMRDNWMKDLIKDLKMELKMVKILHLLLDKEPQTTLKWISLEIQITSLRIKEELLWLKETLLHLRVNLIQSLHHRSIVSLQLSPVRLILTVYFQVLSR